MIQLLSANDIREIKDSFITHLAVEICKIESQMLNADNERTFQWLMDKLSSTTNNKRSQLRHLFEASPPNWVLDTTAFRSWANASNESRWLWGIGEAGTGKTVAAVYLADQLQSSVPSYKLAETIVGLAKSESKDEDRNRIDKYENSIRTAQADSATAAFFFSYKAAADTDAEMVMRSLARQLLEQLHEQNRSCAYRRMSMVQETLSDNVDRKEKTDTQQLLNALLSDFARPYIVLDALDEYPGDWQDLLGQLNSVNASVKIVVTSRGGHEDYMRREALKRGELVFSVGENEDIIKASVLAKFTKIASRDSSEGFVSSTLVEAALDSNKREEMAEIIKRKADHNFLCSSLHVKSLGNAESAEDLQTLLNNLPEGLNQVLADTLQRVQAQSTGQAEIGRLALQWAIYARRNLNLNELQHAIAASRYPSRESLNDRVEEFTERVIVVSTKRFLTIDKKKIIHIHKSIRDFCGTEGQEGGVDTIHFPNSHAEMARVCLRYLDPHNFRGHCDTQREWQSRSEEYPFLKYAAANWGYHLKRNEEEQQEKDKKALRKLLKNDKILEMSTAALHDELKDIGVWHDKVGWDVLKWSPTRSPVFSTIHLLAYFDLGETVEEWLQEEQSKPGFDVDQFTALNPATQNGHTALRIACRMNNESVVRVLLEDGANPLKECGHKMFALSAAASRGHHRIVRILLDVEQDKALEILQQRNHINVQPLLDSITSSNEDTVTAILEKIEELPEAQSLLSDQPNDLSAIQEAARRNLAGIVLRIGEAGGKDAFNQKSKIWQDTAMHVAAHGGFDTLKTLLYNLQADPNQRQKQGKTPLHLAVQGEYVRTGAISAALVDHLDTDIEALDNEGKTILHLNADCGRPLHIDTIMRRAPRSHLTRKAKNGQTPLGAALRTRYGNWQGSVLHTLEISRPEEILLEDAKEVYREAIQLRDVFWLEQLLDKTPNASEALPETSNIIIHDIVQTGSLELLKCAWDRLKTSNSELLEHRDEGGKTPLVLAASFLHIHLVKFLIEAGANKNAQGGFGRTALHWAVDNNNVEVADYLLSVHVDYNLIDNTGMKALQRVAADSTISQNRRAREADYRLRSTRFIEKELLHTHKATPLYVTGDEETRKMILDQVKSIPKGAFRVESMRYLVSDPIPQSSKIPLSRIYVSVRGHDQGESDHLKGHPQDRGKNFNGSNTWYDLALLRGDEIIHQYEWSRNLIGAAATWYESSWHIDKGHDNSGIHPGGVSKWTREQDREEVRKFVRETRHGDRIVLIARTRWRGWLCGVEEAEIRCYYRDWKKPNDE